MDQRSRPLDDRSASIAIGEIRENLDRKVIFVSELGGADPGALQHCSQVQPFAVAVDGRNRIATDQRDGQSKRLPCRVPEPLPMRSIDHRSLPMLGLKDRLGDRQRLCKKRISPGFVICIA